MNVLDASALLAFLQGERGSDVVEAAMEDGGVCGTANWSEVAQKILASGRDWVIAGALLDSYGISLEPVSAADAELAASLWWQGTNLSLADRLCLALGHRLDSTVWTADRELGDNGRVRQIR